MADLIIKGAEMPRFCYICPCDIPYPSYGKSVCGVTGEETTQYGEKRREDCPLVEIPPHGRLIDADEFIKGHCNLCDGKCENTYCDCLSCEDTMRCDMIRDFADAPTVLPAELKGGE